LLFWTGYPISICTSMSNQMLRDQFVLWASFKGFCRLLWIVSTRFSALAGVH
jgi:hypothetical protein